MKNKTVNAILGGLLLAACCGSAGAMTLQEAASALAALRGLDGHEQVVKEGGQEKAVLVPYQLSGLVRLSVARDISKLRALLEDFESAKKAKVAEVTGGKEVKQGSAEEKALIEEVQKMLQTQIDEKGLVKLSTQDLGLMPPVSNPIPASLLSNLGPLLDLEEKEGKK